MKKRFYIIGAIITGFLLIIVIVLGVSLKKEPDIVIKKKIDSKAEYIWYCQGCAWNKAHTFISCQMRRSIRGERFAREAVIRAVCEDLKLGEYGKECTEKNLFRLRCSKKKRKVKR